MTSNCLVTMTHTILQCNSQVINPDTLIKYPHRHYQQGLITTTLGLEMDIEAHHFQDGEMRVKCVASVSPLLWQGDKENVFRRRMLEHQETMLLGECCSWICQERVWRYTVEITINFIIFVILLLLFVAVRSGQSRMQTSSGIILVALVLILTVASSSHYHHHQKWLQLWVEWAVAQWPQTAASPNHRHLNHRD